MTMSDLETRLSEALHDGAAGAPSAVGLAAAARSRARARRRTRVGAAGVVAALAIGVPTAVVATRGGSGDSDPHRSGRSVATDPQAGGTQLPAGFHYESWHDVSVLVPDSWVYGSVGQWCVDDNLPDGPRIDRPGGVSTQVLCTPQSGPGVTFQEVDNTDDFEWPLTQQDPKSWPADVWVGAHGIGGVLVQVALPDRDLAQQILDSVRHNDVLDPNGCPVDTGSDPAFPADSMAVCRYDGQGQLEQSEALTGSDLKRADEALRLAASERGGMSCSTDAPVLQTIRMASAATDATLVLTDDCAELSLQGAVEALGPDVLYWALSPGWSGSVPAGVSLPSVLRGP
jgi:hypothetical protein